MDTSKRCQWCWICGPGAPKSDRNIEVRNSWQHPFAVRLMQILIDIGIGECFNRLRPPFLGDDDVPLHWWQLRRYAAHIPWFWCRNQPHPRCIAWNLRRSEKIKGLQSFGPLGTLLSSTVIFLLVVLLLGWLDCHGTSSPKLWQASSEN